MTSEPYEGAYSAPQTQWLDEGKNSAKGQRKEINGEKGERGKDNSICIYPLTHGLKEVSQLYYIHLVLSQHLVCTVSNTFCYFRRNRCCILIPPIPTHLSVAWSVCLSSVTFMDPA